jgi:acid stress-induced BolA-like protein IbaG/YrbA
VTGANPLYPLSPKEVRLILDVYIDLKTWKREDITNILTGRTNTIKINIYNAIVKHAFANRSSLNEYRDIYARLGMSMEGRSLHHLYRIVDSIDTQHKQDKTETSINNFIELQSQEKPRHIERNDSHSASEDEDLLKNKYTRTDDTVRPMFTDEDESPWWKGKYSLLKKEKERLDRIYSLLPEFSTKSITKALSGTSKK